MKYENTPFVLNFKITREREREREIHNMKDVLRDRRIAWEVALRLSNAKSLYTDEKSTEIGEIKNRIIGK